MTQEDKKLLIKDLSARLPYGVCVEHTSGFRGTLHDLTVYFTYNDDDTIKDYMCYTDFFGDESCKIEFFKPYLFPLSSMTDSHWRELTDIVVGEAVKSLEPDYVDNLPEVSITDVKVIDWFNKNHFDYRGLIPKGLALDATGQNIY